MRSCGPGYSHTGTGVSFGTLATLLEAADAASCRSSSDLAAELLQLGVLLFDVAEEAGQNQHLLLMLPLDGREASMERELLVLKG